MFTKIGPEFQYLEGYDQNSNVSKERGQKSNVRKDKIRIPMFTKMWAVFKFRKDKVRIPMLGRNSNV